MKPHWAVFDGGVISNQLDLPAPGPSSRFPAEQEQNGLGESRRAPAKRPGKRVPPSPAGTSGPYSLSQLFSRTCPPGQFSNCANPLCFSIAPSRSAAQHGFHTAPFCAEQIFFFRIPIREVFNVGEAAGGSAAACCLVHIDNLPYLNSEKENLLRAEGSSVEPMLCSAARWGNRETKRICAVGKLPGGTGRKRQTRPERRAPRFSRFPAH